MNKFLQNIKVLDLSRYISGPFAGMILGDFGADVVKVEKAGCGDDTRRFEPTIEGESIYTFAVNRNKRSIEVNFRSEEGQSLLKRLAKKADVLIENFRPGTMTKMNCDYSVLREINPELIMVSISGFGSEGPYRDKPAFDAAIQAMSGLMSLTGEEDGPPMMHGDYIVDHLTALYAVIAIQSALMEREITRKGQHIELSLLECASTIHLSAIANQQANNVTTTRIGNQDRYLSPGNCYRTKDGEYVYLIAGSDAHFPKLCKAMGNEELTRDARFDSQKKRYDNRYEMDRIVGSWMARNTEAEIQKALNSQGLVCARVENIKDLVNNPQLKYENKLVSVEHPKMGKVLMMGMPYNFSEDVEFPLKACPMLGQHNKEVLKEWLGMDDAQAGRMMAGNAMKKQQKLI